VPTGPLALLPRGDLLVAGAFGDDLPFELRILRFSAIRALCGARDYAKPQRQSGGVACISIMWDSALYRLEQRRDQRVGRFESPTTQAKWHNRLDRLQLLRWIHPQIDFGRADIRVAEP